MSIIKEALLGKPQYLKLAKTEIPDTNPCIQSEEEHLEIFAAQQRYVWRRRFIFASFLNIVLIGALSICVALLICHHASSSSGVRAPHTPASRAIQHVNKWLVGDPDTPKFTGPPRAEMDEAWHTLLEGTLIRVSGEELAASNATSISHRQGGFVAGLGVSHSLHCLKRLNQYFHREYYYSHKDQDWDELQNHAEHCLESLRQNVLCQPDISLYTLEWTKHNRHKPAVRVPEAHKCVDWDILHTWMKGRAATIDSMVPPDPALYDPKVRSEGG